MRVLQISNYYYPKLGGIEKVTQDVASVLKNAGIEQRIICFNEDAADGEHICHRNETTTETINGIEVIRCGCFAKVASQSLSLVYRKILENQITEFKPDVILFHYPNPFVAHALLSLKYSPYKLIIWWHLDITKQKLLKYLFYFQTLKLIRKASAVLCSTKKLLLESEFSERFSDKGRIVPFMINESRSSLTGQEKDEVQQLRSRWQGKVICFFVGRHVPYKGLDTLIAAARSLAEDRFVFLIAGSGPETQRLKNEASSLSNVHFLGTVSESQKRVLMSAADIFCFPSITKNESFGLSLAEAMLLGCPAVTYSVKGSGINEVNLDGVTGIECRNSDYRQYAEALDTLARNPEMRRTMAKAAHDRIRLLFSKERFTGALLKVLTD